MYSTDTLTSRVMVLMRDREERVYKFTSELEYAITRRFLPTAAFTMEEGGVRV